MKAMEIFYFTGTGNSLFVAEELQKRCKDVSLVPVASLLGDKSVKPEAETVGFVFPIHQTMLPIPVRQLLEGMRFENTSYIFAIATRIGTTHSAFREMDRILKKQGKRLDLYYSLNMPSNDPKFNYVVPSEDKIKYLEGAALSNLERIAGKINQKEVDRHADDTCTLRIPFVSLLAPLVKMMEGRPVNLYSDGKCTGCGICEKICPSGKITMVHNKPVWQTSVKCYKCSACLNYCPVQSVQMKSFTEKNGRYSHPYADIDAIAHQKIHQ